MKKITREEACRHRGEKRPFNGLSVSYFIIRDDEKRLSRKVCFAENSAASGHPPDMKGSAFRARCWGIFSTLISRADFVKQEQQLLLDNSCLRAF